jgi:glycosyltransferase involved in cell wall biosynthesis
VWAVSEASRSELRGFWRWQGIEHVPSVDVLALGADFDASPRTVALKATAGAHLLSVGILEPRKNQLFLLDVCESLWKEGLRFDLHLVGRVNPFFGTPILDRIKSMRRKFPGLCYHEAAGDKEVAELYSLARASVFPTIAEGCGLPLLESLWKGVPCICSDLPVLRENANGGGCECVAQNDLSAWRLALRRILTDQTYYRRMATQTAERMLPTWAGAAETICRRLELGA